MGATKPPAAAARTSVLASELRVLIGRLRRRMQGRGDSLDLTRSQSAVLGRLERHGPATVTTLARDEGVRPQSMGSTLCALKAAGLVSGAPDPNDGRQTILSLTPACRARIKAGRLAREDWLFHAIRRNLSDEEQNALAGAIGLLKRLADSPP